MTSIRRLFFVVVTLALTTFALPSFAAPAKIFGLTMGTMVSGNFVPGGNFVAGQVNTLAAKYTNLTPNGNSTINWVHLTVPKTLWNANPSPPPVTPTIAFPNGGALYSIDTSAANTVEIVVNGIPGIGSGGASWIFTIDVYVPASPTCADYMFAAQAFTGNSGTQGQPFEYKSTYAGPPPFTSKPDIAVVAGCPLKFLKQPANTVSGNTITSVPNDPSGAAVQVALTTDGTNVAPWFSGQITLAIKSGTGTSGAVLLGGSATASSGVASFPSLKIAQIGTNYQLTASSTGFMSVDSNQFSIFGGILGCDSTNNHAGNPDIDPTGDITYTGTADWALVRATTPGCTPVPYTFNFDPANKKFSFIADKGNPPQQLLVEYIVLWNPENTVDGYPTDYHLNLAWGFPSEPPANYFVPSLACLDDVLAFTSLATIPNVEPFITKSKPVNQGGLGLTQYTPGTTAAMCQAAHGWGSVGNGQVQFVDKVIDTDGYGSRS